MYTEIIAQMVKQLRQLDGWLEKAIEYAKSRTFEPDNFLGLRLAPDQFAFARQVQVACDAVRIGVARITGIESPTVADTEKTMDELRARVKLTIELVGKVTPAQFEGVASRTFTTPRWQGKTMNGHDYVLEHLVPNFYFHLTHVYAILRHGGVQLGKADYLGPITMKAP
jgi:hypothetical protein